MAEYVDREALLAHLRKCKETSTGSGLTVAVITAIQSFVEGMPLADVTPVVHGRWIRPHWKNSNYCCDCSECGGEAMHRDYQWDKNGIYPICPDCGAKMDGRGEDDGQKD